MTVDWKENIVINRTQQRVIIPSDDGVYVMPLESYVRYTAAMSPCLKDNVERRKPVVRTYTLVTKRPRSTATHFSSPDHESTMARCASWWWKNERTKPKSWKKHRKFQARDMHGRDTIRTMEID